eukprot:19964-Heterococcus_DN1.PRE.1
MPTTAGNSKQQHLAQSCACAYRNGISVAILNCHKRLHSNLCYCCSSEVAAASQGLAAPG